jgi:hypothetical protein
MSKCSQFGLVLASRKTLRMAEQGKCGRGTFQDTTKWILDCDLIFRAIIKAHGCIEEVRLPTVRSDLYEYHLCPLTH